MVDGLQPENHQTDPKLLFSRSSVVIAEYYQLGLSPLIDRPGFINPGLTLKPKNHLERDVAAASLAALIPGP